MGETVRRRSTRKLMEEGTNLGMIPNCVRGRHPNGWKKAQSGTHVAKIDETPWFGEAYHVA